MADYKVLVTGPSWIGDMVMAQSLFKLLHGKYPGVILDVLAPAWTLPVVERMPEVRRGIAFQSRHGKLDLTMRVKLGLQLKLENYDEAIIIPRSLKSVIPSWVAGIKKRTGLTSQLGLINNTRQFVKDRHELFVRRYLALASEDAYKIDKEDIPKPQLRIRKENSEKLMHENGLVKDGFVAFAPGAEFGPSKQWPAKHFAQLASGLESRDLRSIIIGSDKEFQFAEEIISQSTAINIINLCGKTSLPEVIDILACARAAVSNDSGLMHLAYAAGTHVIALYGSSSPDYTPPLSDNSLILQEKMSCQPCFERTCRYGHYNCMNQLLPETLLGSKFLQ
jgi:heptosyltransferase-2